MSDEPVLSVPKAVETPVRKRHKTGGDLPSSRKRTKDQDDLPDTSPEMVKSLFLAWGQIVLVSQGAKLLPAMVSIISISI